MTVFAYVGNWFDTQLVNYSTVISGVMVTDLLPVFLVATTLWMTIDGYQIATGQVSGDLPQFLWRAARLVLIDSVLFVGGNYATNVVGIVNDLMLQLANLMVPATTGTMTTSPWNLIDQVAVAQAKYVQAVMNEVGVSGWMFNLDLLLAVLLMILASGIVMFVVAYIVLVAKLYLWFYLAVGPLFIVLATFNATTQFFWSWVKCVVTSVVTMMVAFFIVGVVVYVSEHVIDASVSSLGTVQKTINVLGDSAGLVAILLLMALIAYQAPHVAASLTGGSPMSQGGSLARDVMRFVQSRGLGAAGPGTSGSVQPQGAMGRMMRGAQQLAGRATSAVGLRTQMAYQRAAAAARSRW